jgi:hypothetical protein
MLKLESEPIATGVVRELTGETNLRDEDDADYLPPSVSKRSCYGQKRRKTAKRLKVELQAQSMKKSVEIADV